jgi:excisionase family DNA binding protein
MPGKALATSPLTLTELSDRATVTVGEAAATLQVSKNTVYRMLDDGTLPAIRSGKIVRISGPGLLALVSGGTPVLQVLSA